MDQLKFIWTIAQKDDGKTLRTFLLKDKMVSRQALTDIKNKGGALKVNDEMVTVRHKLQPGEIVTVCFPKEEVSEYMKPIALPLDIVYEDDHFLAINKVSDLPTIPSRFGSTESLAQGVLHYYQTRGISSTIHPVNRLDRNTTGIVLFAKHRYGHSLMSKQLQSGAIDKRYIALCHGNPPVQQGVIEEPIGRKEGSIIERCVTGEGQYSKTLFEVLEEFDDYSLVKLKLETGRTHQIRVHMAYKGYPLLGDDLYGGDHRMIERQALHSTSLSFYHPFTEMRVEIEAPLPEDMKRLI